jgi:DNA-binding protein HU-beta
MAEASQTVVYVAVRHAGCAGGDVAQVALNAVRGAIAAMCEVGGDVERTTSQAMRGALQGAGELGETVARAVKEVLDTEVEGTTTLQAGGAKRLPPPRRTQRPMNKADRVTRIAKDADLTKRQSEKVLDVLLESIQIALSRGKPVTLVGFGTFSVMARAARKGRNPRAQDPEVPGGEGFAGGH